MLKYPQLDAEFERRLHKQCQELSNEISKNLKKLSTALKMNEDDQATIQSLKSESDKNWALVDESQEKEVERKERNKYQQYIKYNTYSAISCVNLYN